MNVRREPPGPPDPHLDRLRHGWAAMFDDGSHVGYLATRVSLYWREVGHLWTRRYVDPGERVSWEIYWTRRPDWVTADYLDGIEADTAEARRWADGTFTKLAKPLALRWIDATTPEGFAAFVHARLDYEGLTAEVAWEASNLPGATGVWLVEVDWPTPWPDDPEATSGMAFLLSDNVTRVALIDPDQEDVTPEQAIEYLIERMHGRSPKEAWKLIRKRQS
jgi:hypothetical protein